ncbi:4-hydroxybenzoate 3-monooxygenase [Paracraurococcus lichenis]|uniref:4-hydroxybenzoate 3-monooxygenase n=1 Tax=Paracraurococcus lichenis TaxID=3064888 RepID=A0ABT9E9B4_9PROT|nr:4-hydroxybenzoate 3-monooxygenase [Paracraurococcus sp. LOR1-02]MDO9712779.1 4-hydroxybenzoate 3-monooxygenase [Paracraurococcus sp. LOR1-02]
MLRTQVGIVGAGPAGLLLSLMLQRRGIDSVIIEARDREAIEATIRAGILEQSTVDLMAELGVADRLRREGVVHEGTILRFGGRNHRIDFKELTGGRVATLYPQHEVLKDLIAARLAQGGRILFGTKVNEVADVGTAAPVIRFAGADGAAGELRCDVVIGADGSYGACRPAIPADRRRDFLRIYPFGWFGILCEAPVSSEELIYARHERGFALISSRTPEVQRMYFQCDPNDSVENWSEDRIWAELQARVAGEDGFRLKQGRIFQKNIVPMRSFVCEPMQYGRLFLAGDAAHAVPPTGAKGLNLAASDVWHLDRALGAFFADGSTALMEGYSAAALRRVWRAQHFSWWMTSMLHRFPDASEFDDRRQLAELELVTGTMPAATSLAQTYVGMPFG